MLQLWAHHKLALGGTSKSKVASAAEVCVSPPAFGRKVKDVGCNLWSGLEEAQTVLFVALLGTGGVEEVGKLMQFSVVFLFFTQLFSLPLGTMCSLFVWRPPPRWCHRRTGHDVEVLHLKPNYKVGDHMAEVRTSLACSVSAARSSWADDRSSLRRYSEVPPIE